MEKWQEQYKKKWTTPEEAVRLIRSGDRIVLSGGGTEPRALCQALAARKEELRDVKLIIHSPTQDFGWFQTGWEDSFQVKLEMNTPLTDRMVAEKRCDILVGFFVPFRTPEGAKKDYDFLLTEVSPPDSHGFCSCGSSRLAKKEIARRSKTVIVEVNERLIRTFGDNFLSVSEIDYFVPHTPSGKTPGTRGIRGGGTEAETLERVRPFAQLVSPLIKDGDTLQIGVGSYTEPLPRAGLFKGKHDLGWHSEATPRGVARWVEQGVITGKYKTLHPGKIVATTVGGGDAEDLKFIHDNPLFELHGIDYVGDPRVIAAHDNMVSINQALAIDLTGQITAESIGTKLLSASGGHLAFAIGASLSKGGRYIIVLPSTAQKGAVSTIVPLLEAGTIITVPRTIVDIVVTEYGVAHLRGKSQRERAEELIRIAHPDFRAALRKEAKKLYSP